MELKELESRMHHFVDSKGWYAPDSPKPQSPRNLAASLAIEAAEVLEHFQWRETIKNKEDFAGELADVALYLMQRITYCFHLQFSIENLQKNLREERWR